MAPALQSETRVSSWTTGQKDGELHARRPPTRVEFRPHAPVEHLLDLSPPSLALSQLAAVALEVEPDPRRLELARAVHEHGRERVGVEVGRYKVDLGRLRAEKLGRGVEAREGGEVRVEQRAEGQFLRGAPSARSVASVCKVTRGRWSALARRDGRRRQCLVPRPRPPAHTAPSRLLANAQTSVPRRPLSAPHFPASRQAFCV